MTGPPSTVSDQSRRTSQDPSRSVENGSRDKKTVFSRFRKQMDRSDLGKCSCRLRKPQEPFLCESGRLNSSGPVTVKELKHPVPST